MKHLIVGFVALAAATLAAPVSFKTAHEFSGLRSALEVWQPADSLSLYDFIGKQMAVKPNPNDINNNRPSKILGEKLNEYEADLRKRFDVLNPGARDFIYKLNEAANEIYRDIQKKAILALEEYNKLPNADNDSLKHSFPSTFGSLTKLVDHIKAANAASDESSEFP